MQDRVAVIQAHNFNDGGVKAVCFSGDAQKVVSVGKDGTLACWNWRSVVQTVISLKSYTVLLRIEHHGVISLELDPSMAFYFSTISRTTVISSVYCIKIINILYTFLFCLFCTLVSI